MDYIKEFYTEYSFFIQLLTLIIVTITIIRSILKEIEKKSYLTLTPSIIESRGDFFSTIKVRAYNKSKRAIKVLICHLLTKRNEDITANCFMISTQGDNSSRSISEDLSYNLTIPLPYKGHIDFYFVDIKYLSPNSYIAYIECEQDGIFKRIESHSEFERILRIGQIKNN